MPTARNTENVVVRESTIDVEMNADGIPSTAPEGGRNELVAAGAHSFCCAHACLFCESSHCPPLSALHSTSRRHTEIRFATPPPQSSPHRLSVEHQHTNFIMPKEKTTTRGSKKAAGKADGGKKKKDPNMPKRGLSAYMFFANDTRDKVRDENPGIKFGEVGKILGERWKALNEKQKAPYEAKAAADKKRYEEEKAAYTAGGDASEEEEE
ncbi:uncharacterized protein RHO25_003486 [Cercospora beticola]|nr:hypothetical protein RHO25_003486 [Cercospora beticola]